MSPLPPTFWSLKHGIALPVHPAIGWCSAFETRVMFDNLLGFSKLFGIWYSLPTSQPGASRTHYYYYYFFFFLCMAAWLPSQMMQFTTWHFHKIYFWANLHIDSYTQFEAKMKQRQHLHGTKTLQIWDVQCKSSKLQALKKKSANVKICKSNLKYNLKQNGWIKIICSRVHTPAKRNKNNKIKIIKVQLKKKKKITTLVQVAAIPVCTSAWFEYREVGVKHFFTK